VPQRIAIDIDSTLHDYWAQFREVARRRTGVDLPYEAQTDWLVSEISRDQLRAIVAETHTPGMVAAAVPYDGAVETINAWHAAGHFIHITSHRAADCQTSTAAWLEAIGLRHDELYCSYDKVSRCVELGIDILIDDSPINLERAQQQGIRPVTLSHPWNADACREHNWLCAPDWPALRVALEPVLGAQTLARDIAGSP
jgi:5'(3')-deoxyribonucleotidase